MTIKTYICPDIHCENCAAKVRQALQNAPAQGVDILVDQKAVRVGLIDEADDELIKQCLSNAGFPPSEVIDEEE